MRLLSAVRSATCAATLATLATLPIAASAQPTSFVFFGDSFVDAGNARVIAGAQFPYPSGRFSDGPVFSEYLADAFGRTTDARASLLGGQNYAIGGATTGTGNVAFGPGFGLLSQVATYAGTNPAPSAGRTAVLFAGGNDFINTAAPNPAQMIANMTGAAATLRGLGITQFLIPTLPDLSRTPRGLARDAATRAALSFGISQYNTGLLTAFGLFAQQTGASVIGFRLDNLFLDLLNNPGRYGFTDTTRPCIPVTGYSVAPSCATSVFFEDLHPTTAAHAVVGQAAAQAVLQATIPEPATMVLVGTGLVAVGAAASRRRRLAA
jgi:outer membrane lipase/esterase